VGKGIKRMEEDENKKMNYLMPKMPKKCPKCLNFSTYKSNLKLLFYY
jgi:hypothetical protein